MAAPFVGAGMGSIEVERHEEAPYATVIITNPGKRNAISRDDTRDLAAAFRELDADDDVRAAVLTGAGDAFCAGLDLTSIGGEPTAELVDRSFHGAVREIATCAMPVIARVEGPAVGAGAALAVACDLVYAADDARIGFSFSRIGLSADTGATWTLPRLVGVQAAFELLATGRIVPAEEAAELGIVTEVLEPEGLDDRVHDRAVELSTGPTRALSAMRPLLLRANANTLEEHLEREAHAQIGMYHSTDATEGMAAFVEDRAPEFAGR